MDNTTWLTGNKTNVEYKGLLPLLEEKRERRIREVTEQISDTNLYVDIIKAARLALLKNQFMGDTKWSIKVLEESIFHYDGLRFVIQTTFPRRLQTFFRKVFFDYDKEFWLIPLLELDDGKLDYKCILKPNWLGTSDNNCYIIEFHDAIVMPKMERLREFGIRITPHSMNYIKEKMNMCLHKLGEFKTLKIKKD